MRLGFRDSPTNQIGQGAGLIQPSGREKVTVIKRVSEESGRLPGRLLLENTKRRRVFTERFVVKTQTVFLPPCEGYFFVTPSLGFHRTGAPLFLVSLTAQLGWLGEINNLTALTASSGEILQKWVS